MKRQNGYLFQYHLSEHHLGVHMQFHVQIMPKKRKGDLSKSGHLPSPLITILALSRALNLSTGTSHHLSQRVLYGDWLGGGHAR